jgi:hypothetical protein
LFFIGQEPPQQLSQHAVEPVSPCAFIGQESPLQQQSALLQHEVFE